MKKSKYEKYKKEIFAMKTEGKTYAAISKFLNKKDKKLGADPNSLKVFFKRHKDKKNEKTQKSNAKTVPENKEGAQKKEDTQRKEPPQKEEPDKEESPKDPKKKEQPKKSKTIVVDTAPLKAVHKDFSNLEKDYQVNNNVYSTMNNELGVTSKKLENVAMRKAYPFLITGIILTLLVASSLGDIYVTRCLPRRDAWIIGYPAGLPFIIAINIIILYKAGLGKFINTLIRGGTAIISTAALTVVLKIYIPGRTGMIIGLAIVALTLFCLMFPKKKDN